MRITVITVSDRASRGEYEDLTGPLIQKDLAERFPGAAVSRVVVADEPAQIRGALEASSSSDFILTTGGTGISPRDVTPEVTAEFCERELPGVAEAIRAASLVETPAAMLSRGYAGTRGACIVVNFPGSVKAVRLCLQVVAPIMEHALRMLKGEGH